MIKLGFIKAAMYPRSMIKTFLLTQRSSPTYAFRGYLSIEPLRQYVLKRRLSYDREPARSLADRPQVRMSKLARAHVSKMASMRGSMMARSLFVPVGTEQRIPPSTIQRLPVTKATDNLLSFCVFVLCTRHWQAMENSVLLPTRWTPLHVQITSNSASDGV